MSPNKPATPSAAQKKTYPVLSLLGLILIGALAYWIFENSDSLSLTSPVGSRSMKVNESIPPIHPEPQTPNPTIKEESSNEPRALPSAGTLRSKIPSLQSYQASAHRDPHGVPEVVREFSATLTQVMTPAMSSEAAARAILPELGDCSATAEVQTIRLQCLANLRRLNQHWPSLKNELDLQIKRAKASDLQRLDSLGL